MYFNPRDRLRGWINVNLYHRPCRGFGVFCISSKYSKYLTVFMQCGGMYLKNGYGFLVKRTEEISCGTSWRSIWNWKLKFASAISKNLYMKNTIDQMDIHYTDIRNMNRSLLMVSFPFSVHPNIRCIGRTCAHNAGIRMIALGDFQRGWRIDRCTMPNQNLNAHIKCKVIIIHRERHTQNKKENKVKWNCTRMIVVNGC